MALLLRRSELSTLLDLHGAMSVLEQTFREQSAGQVKQVAPLFEISSGKLLCLMGYPFGNLRIGATVGLAIDRFAPSNARTVAIIGSGRLALSILEPAIALRSIERVFVYSRSAEKREGFASKASERLRIPVIPRTSPQQAIEDADFVLVSTNSPFAALLGKWLHPGIAVFGVGRPNEFDDDVYLGADLIVVTSKAHEMEYYDTKLDQPLIRLSRQGAISWQSVVEFADILAGKISPKKISNGIVVFRDSQGGYGDVALAAWAYEEARRRGLGQEISTEL